MFKINDHDGLTPFGLQYIKEMERLGIIIDVSHLSDAGFYDVYHHTTNLSLPLIVTLVKYVVSLEICQMT